MSPIKEANFRKKLLALAVLAPAMALTACGGSSSSSDDTTTPEDPATSETSGLAYDGYLRGATVCVDLNLNKRCSADEPLTVTGAGGVFTLDELTEGQAKLPLALLAKGGETIDEDTGEAVDNDFTYLAPAGSRTVSGFSTIIQVNVEQGIADGATVADALAAAKAKLATDLGVADTDIDFTNYDPIAIAATNTDASDLAGRLHIVNQITTRNLASSVTQAQAVEGAPDNFGAIVSAAVSKVGAKVSTVKTLVDTAVLDSGVSAPDLAVEDLDTILEEILTNPEAQPEPVTADDIIAAKDTADAAKDAIYTEIEEETGEDLEPTGATGGTGGSSDGGQGTE